MQLITFRNIIIILTLIFIYISARILKIRHKKINLYKLALQRSKNTNKPLIVIGDPDNGHIIHRAFYNKILGTPYGYGDLCIDLSGCPNNTISKNIKGKLEDILPSINTNSHVVYVSQTLEYIDTDKIRTVLEHLMRISGKDIFIVDMDYKIKSVEKFMSHTDTYNDSTGQFECQNMFLKCPPTYNYFEYISKKSPIHHFVY